MATTVIAPDGSAYHIDIGDMAVRSAWGFISWVDGPRGRRRLDVGAAGANESVLPHEAPASSVRRSTASLEGYSLLGLEYLAGGQTLFVLKGRHHELYTSIGGTGVPLDVFVDWISPLDVHDGPEGMTILPRAGTGLSVSHSTGFNVIDGVATVQLYPIDSVRSTLPRHRGKRVNGAEMWQLEDQRAPEGRSVLLANDTAAVLLRPIQARPEFTSLAETLAVRHERA